MAGLRVRLTVPMPTTLGLTAAMVRGKGAAPAWTLAHPRQAANNSEISLTMRPPEWVIALGKC
jgi:hypothetical protein